MQQITKVEMNGEDLTGNNIKFISKIREENNVLKVTLSQDFEEGHKINLSLDSGYSWINISAAFKNGERFSKFKLNQLSFDLCAILLARANAVKLLATANAVAGFLLPVLPADATKEQVEAAVNSNYAEANSKYQNNRNAWITSVQEVESAKQIQPNYGLVESDYYYPVSEKVDVFGYFSSTAQMIGLESVKELYTMAVDQEVPESPEHIVGFFRYQGDDYEGSYHLLTMLKDWSSVVEVSIWSPFNVEIFVNSFLYYWSLWPERIWIYGDLGPTWEEIELINDKEEEAATAANLLQESRSELNDAINLFSREERKRMQEERKRIQEGGPYKTELTSMPNPVASTMTLADLSNAYITTYNGGDTWTIPTTTTTLNVNIIIDVGQSLEIGQNATFTINSGVYIHNKGTFKLMGSNPPSSRVNNYGVFINEGLITSSNRYEYFYNYGGGYFFNFNTSLTGGGSYGDNKHLYNMTAWSGSKFYDVKSTTTPEVSRYSYVYGDYIPSYGGGVPYKTPLAPIDRNVNCSES